MATDIYGKIGVSEGYLVEMIRDVNANGLVSQDYIRPIAERIAPAVARDIWETADPEDWNDDDVRLAVGRVLCKRLHIGI